MGTSHLGEAFELTENSRSRSLDESALSQSNPLSETFNIPWFIARVYIPTAPEAAAHVIDQRIRNSIFLQRDEKEYRQDNTRQPPRAGVVEHTECFRPKELLSVI